VIATLATQADEAGIKTTVVSTDRDAFQLVTENVALMMTPRGVSDVNVYTPDRVEARYGIRPDQVPDFIGSRATPRTTSRRSGDRRQDRRAADLAVRVARGDRARRRALARAQEEHHRARRQARQSKELATMRRDLELDCDVTQLVSRAGPLAAEGDLPQVRVPEPAAPGRRARRRGPGRSDAARKTTVPWSEELSNSLLQGGRWRSRPRRTDRGRRSGARRRLAAAGALEGS
jgi:hypothetical protein